MSKRKERNARVPRADALANRAAILAAASEAFAAGGFHGTNIRSICRKAGVDVGAVNRHFGGKEKLYNEVVIQAGHALFQKNPLPRLEDFDSPEDALKAWIAFLLRLILIKRIEKPIVGALFMAEVRNPTAALDNLVDELFKPVRAELVRMIEALMGEGATKSRVEAATDYIHSLCAFQEFGAPILERLGRKPPASTHEISQLMKTLYPFARAGVLALKKQ